MGADPEHTPRPAEIAQTLDRGLQVLEALASHTDGLSPTDVAHEIGVHRSIAARLLTTLLARGYVMRRPDGRYVLGSTLITLARQVSRNLLVVAAPLLSEAAERLGVTAVLHIADRDEAVAIASIEPRNAQFHVGIYPGTRHPLGTAASGLAILAGRPPQPGERPEVTEARLRGYALTTGELVPNVTGVSAGVRLEGSTQASLGLIMPADERRDHRPLGHEVMALAEKVSRSLL